MLFSSLTFLYFFLPIVLILYFVINNRTWRNAVLLVSSLVFYSWGEPKYVFLMLASTLVAWLCGLGIDRFKEKRRISRAFLIASLVLLLGSLAVFKYLNFFVENLNRIDGVALKVWNIALPIGISFYTFQILSYLIDLYWEKVSVQKSYFRFTLYVCLFPQLIAGPIVRYETVEQARELGRSCRRDAPVHSGSCEKGAHCEQRRRSCGVYLFVEQRGERSLLAGRRMLHASDILRFLRLQRHGHWPWPHIRLPLP